MRRTRGTGCRTTTSAPAIDSRLGDAPTPGPTATRGGTGTPGPGAPTAPADATPPAPTEPGEPPGSGEPTSPPADVTVSYEAEDASIGGFASSYRAEGASGGRAVQGIGLWGMNYVEFPQVEAPAAGEHTLTVYYLGTSNRRGQLSINGGPAVEVDFPGLERGEVGAVSVPVELIEGQNTIRVSGAGINGPDLDQITISGPPA